MKLRRVYATSHFSCLCVVAPRGRSYPRGQCLTCGALSGLLALAGPRSSPQLSGVRLDCVQVSSSYAPCMLANSTGMLLLVLSCSCMGCELTSLKASEATFFLARTAPILGGNVSHAVP